MSPVMVHVSNAYKSMVMTRERISPILSFQMTFSLVVAAVVLGCPGEYFGLGSLIGYYSSQIFKTTYGLQLLVIYGNVSACLH